MVHIQEEIELGDAFDHRGLHPPSSLTNVMYNGDVQCDGLIPSHHQWQTVEGEQFEGVRDVGNGYLKSG